MRLWPISLLRQQPFNTATVFSLLAGISLTPTTASAVHLPAVVGTTALLSSSFVGVNAAAAPIGGIPVQQRNFRLGKPAAHLSSSNPSSQSFFSTATMSSSPIIPQSNDFEPYTSQPQIDPTPETAQLIKDAIDLFSAKPSPTIFSRSWSPNAIFADPICHAQGSRQYLAQWYGMPAAFSESETLAWKLVKQEPGEVQYAQKQRYKVKGLGMTKEMVSTVVIERNADNKITRFEDRWNHKPLGGVIGWPFRRLNAVTLPWLVGVPKEAKAAVNHKDL